MEIENLVYLKCVKIKSKLRVRIITDGYYKDANCQFPKNIRVENMFYVVNSKYIKLINRMGRKYYYFIDSRGVRHISERDRNILIQDEIARKKIKDNIFEDDENNECVICYNEKKEIVFSPCCHYYCCSLCSSKINKCPICRKKIISKITRNQIN